MTPEDMAKKLELAAKLAEAASGVLSPCDLESEKERGFCMGHGGCFRLPCEYGDLREALDAFLNWRSPEMLELAQKAVDRQEAEKAKLAAMTPEERKKYIEEWASRVAREQVEDLDRIAEANGGCDCGMRHE